MLQGGGASKELVSDGWITDTDSGHCLVISVTSCQLNTEFMQLRLPRPRLRRVQTARLVAPPAHHLRLPSRQHEIRTTNAVTDHTTQLTTGRSQHSQECKDAHRQCFCDSRSWPLTPKLVGFPGLVLEHFSVKFGDPTMHRFLRHHAEKKTGTDKRK